MNRRTFTKYLLAAPIGLATLLTRPLASSVSPVKEKDEELGINCRTCKHKGTDFYYGLCPQNDTEILPQKDNHCFYYEELGLKSQRSALYNIIKAKKEVAEKALVRQLLRAKWPLYHRDGMEPKEDILPALRKELKNHKFQNPI